MSIASLAHALGFGLVLCAAPALAQDQPPPETDASLQASQDRIDITPITRSLGDAGTLSVREVATLPPPALLETDASPEDAPIIRTMIRDEAVHRDRMARVRRLRELARAEGRVQRLAALDRLEELERQQHETRALMARTRLSEPGFRATESFMRQGGILRLRQAQVSRGEVRRVEARPGRADARMVRPSRSSLGGSRARPSAGNGTSRGSRGPRGAGPR